MYGNDRFVDRMPRGGENIDGRGEIVMMVVHLVLVAVFIWAVYMLVRHAVKYMNAKSGAGGDPVAIAAARYAKGEIAKAEFEEIKKTLK